MNSKERTLNTDHTACCGVVNVKTWFPPEFKPGDVKPSIDMYAHRWCVNCQRGVVFSPGEHSAGCTWCGAFNQRENEPRYD